MYPHAQQPSELRDTHAHLLIGQCERRLRLLEEHRLMLSEAIKERDLLRASTHSGNLQIWQQFASPQMTPSLSSPDPTISS